MIQLKRVLVPTDFSEASRSALSHAFELARRFEAEVILVHIRTPLSGDTIQPEHYFQDDGKYHELVERKLTECATMAGSELSVTTTAKVNISAAAGILEAVAESDIDMIVMGTHGRSALAHFFLGSVAEKVVRHSPVPVLTVAPDRDDYRHDARYRKILAAFDFSRHSKGATRGAAQIAGRYGAQLQVLYVIEQEVPPGYYETWKESVSREVPDVEAEARRALKEEGLEGFELCVKVGSGHGKVFREISRFAKEEETDLIVMGTHGLSGFEHMLLGSTTERMVRTAPCPVLTFHLVDWGGD